MTARKHKSFATSYSTAQFAGKSYRVIAQDAKELNAVKFLLLQRPHGAVWTAVSVLSNIA